MRLRASFSVLLALVLAIATSGAALATTYTVTFEGSGTFNATGGQSEAPLCQTPISSTTTSNYKWKVAWKHVALGGGAASPTGTTNGTAHETASQLDDPNRCTYKNCDKTMAFLADNGPNADQPATIKVFKSAGKVQFTTEILQTGTADSVECMQVASYEHYFITGRGLMASGDTLGAMSGSATVPLSQLASNGKIIVVVHSMPANYPQNDDCRGPVPIAGVTCTHSQSWSGTITIQRE